MSKKQKSWIKIRSNEWMELRKGGEKVGFIETLMDGWRIGRMDG